MSEPRHPFATLPAGAPDDEAAREARHALIVELLAARADGELPAETASQIDAHLVGCARCRRELALQVAVRRRLAADPTPPAGDALRSRVAAAIAAAPPPATPRPPGPPRTTARRRAIAWIGGAALATALGVAAAVRPGDDAGAPGVVLAEAPVGDDRLLRAVLADHRRVAARELPGRARDVDAVRAALPVRVDPLEADGLHLLAAWTTDLDGDAAAAFAYRWSDDVVVHYVVAESRFFGSPAVRAGVAAGRVLGARDAGTSLVAWPTAAAGSVLVGDVPPDRLAAILAAARTADARARGAR